MTSRTGGSVGAGGAVAGTRSGDRRAFTLIELLVVMLVIGVLSGILVPVLFKAQEGAKKKWAQKELNELGAVISVYHLDHSAYPPDTDDWGAMTGGNGDSPDDPIHDIRSIHRYLGSKVIDWRDKEYSAYMHMDWKRMTDVDADNIGRFTDPFEVPYELDAMHMIPPDPSITGSTYRQCGWPYVLQTKDNPTRAERQAMVRDFKFVSYGPDGISVDFPFAMGLVLDRPQAPRTGRAKDDICSWE